MSDTCTVLSAQSWFVFRPIPHSCRPRTSLTLCIDNTCIVQLSTTKKYAWNDTPVNTRAYLFTLYFHFESSKQKNSSFCVFNSLFREMKERKEASLVYLTNVFVLFSCIGHPVLLWIAHVIFSWRALGRVDANIRTAATKGRGWECITTSCGFSSRTHSSHGTRQSTYLSMGNNITLSVLFLFFFIYI